MANSSKLWCTLLQITDHGLERLLSDQYILSPVVSVRNGPIMALSILSDAGTLAKVGVAGTDAHAKAMIR